MNRRRKKTGYSKNKLYSFLENMLYLGTEIPTEGTTVLTKMYIRLPAEQTSALTVALRRTVMCFSKIKCIENYVNMYSKRT